MAFYDPKQALKTAQTTAAGLRQPNSVLQPKPGLLDAGGNQPSPVLQQPEQAGTPTPSSPTITPQSEYKPIADPVNASNDPLAYQEALTQGRLTPGAGQLTNNDPNSAGGFGGYDPNKPPEGWDANAWAQAGVGGIDPARGWYQDQRTGEQTRGALYYPSETGGSQFTNIDSPDFDFSKVTDPAQRQAIMSQFTPQEMYKYGIWQKPADAEQLPDWLQPDFQGDALSASGMSGGLTAGPKTSGALDQGIGKIGTPQITPAGLAASESGNKPSASPESFPGTGGFTPASASPTGPQITPKDGTATPSLSIPNEAPSVPQQEGDDSLSRIFKHFKGQLERERDQGLSDADVEAASRGVFYGTPGTTSREAVREKFGRGLGDLEATLLQNESQNELSRLQIASGLFGNMQANDLGRLQIAAGLIPSDMDSEGVDPNLYANLAAAFGKRSAGGVQEPAVPTVSKPKIGMAASSEKPKAATTLKNPSLSNADLLRALSAAGGIKF